MPKISVIIPCFNAEPWIHQTIESVKAQQMDDIEMIVVDDGSTDKSSQIIEKDFPFINLVKTKNQGPSKARNLGTRLSRGEFIQYLDADDLMVPGKLRIQIEALQKSGADVAYGDWQRLQKDFNGIYVKDEVIRRKIVNPEIDLFTYFWCPPAAYLFRRAIVEKVGGWNENLPIIQDARFALDCALKGAAFVYCEGVMAYYRVHPRDSVSHRDPVGFNRDCLRNAIEVEKWWQENGSINDERRKALLIVYGYIARASFEKDQSTFESAYQHLKKLTRRYIPEKPKHLRFASYLVGYRMAEAIALWYRRIKSLFTHFWKRDKF